MDYLSGLEGLKEVRMHMRNLFYDKILLEALKGERSFKSVELMEL